MSVSQNDKLPLKGNRYNFNHPNLDGPGPEWLIPDPELQAKPNGHDSAENVGDDTRAPRHQPAPMKKRTSKSRPNRNGKRLGGIWVAIVLAILVGITSFLLVMDLTGEGRLRSFYLLQAESEVAGATGSQKSNDVAMLQPQASVEVPMPEQLPAPPPALAENTADNIVSNAPQQPAAVAAPVPVAPPPEIQEQAIALVDAPTQLKSEQVAAAEPPPASRQGDVIQDCADCPELIAVSAGSYVIAADKDSKAETQTQKIVQDFAIGRNAITFADWQKCVDQGGCKPVQNDAGWGRGTRPLIFVSYDDVTSQYLPWLSRLSGKVYRLPTKNEWQYAMLGGAGAAQTLRQAGDAAQTCFNASGAPAANCQDIFDGTAPVGSFPANQLGLNDMQGNVWNWSADCWRPFTYAANPNSQNCDTRLVLGGAWTSNREKVGNGITGWEKSSKQANSIGFRVVRNLP